MSVEHSFDWKGFRFAKNIVMVCVIAGIAGHFGLWYTAKASSQPSLPPTVVLVQDAPPLQEKNASFDLSTTTPERIINTLTVADAVPQAGKFIVADLADMKLALYQDGVVVAEYPILTKGKVGSPYETPAGFYNVLLKESDHFNSGQQVHLPWSIQFYGNYFIHGWPYYEDGSPVNPAYSGGCIRLSVGDAKKVFAFAESGTGIFVYDHVRTAPMPSLALGDLAAPLVSAGSYLVADIDTGDVFLEQNAEDQRPIASVTKLMTALVANETIMFNKKVTVTRGELLHTEVDASAARETFVVGDLLYPLLMESNNAVANRLASYYGTADFVDWMNTTAKSLTMQSTHFADASGISAENTSTPDDLYRLAAYIANKKSFIWNITRTPEKRLVADSGNAYRFSNFNIFSDSPDFVGGKVGQTGSAKETMVSVFSLPIEGVQRRVAIVVLRSDSYTDDTAKLVDWFTRSAERGTALARAACASCAIPAPYRKIRY